MPVTRDTFELETPAGNIGVDRTLQLPFKGREKTTDVISITALGIKTADDSHGESGEGTDWTTEAKSLRLKILPLSS